MNIETKQLVWDKFIYPRCHKSPKTIEAYVASMEVGAQFPPIEIQRISDYPGHERIVFLVLDGVHRWLAYQELKVATLEAVEWQPDVVLDYEKHKVELLFRSAQLNLQHGDRMTKTDKKAKARLIAENDTQFQWSEKRIAQEFDVVQKTVNNWIADIRARQKASRDSQILRLDMLGWTQEEIARVVGLAQNTISGIIENSNFTKIDNLLAEGRDMEYVADYLSTDLTLAWALRLKDKSDPERFEELGIKIQPYDVWHFNSCDNRFGREYPGRIPGQLIAHALYFFAEPGARIIDPMAGGGTTNDVCLALGRKCYSYDIEPIREDIIKHDLSEGWPERIKKADLIFWDPPYFSKKNKDYVEGSISGLNQEEYLHFLTEALGSAHAIVKKGTKLAFLMSDWDDDSGGDIFIWDYADIIRDTGWTLAKHIQAPLTTQQVTPFTVLNYREKRKLARLERYLLIARA